MVEISNQGISGDDLVSDETVQVNFAAGEQSSGAAARRIIIIGNKGASGSATLGTIYGPATNVPLANTSDARSLFAESEVFAMYDEVLKVAGSLSVSCVAVAQATGTAATGVISLAGTAAKAGTVEVKVCERVFQVGFAAGDGYGAIAEAVAAVVNSRSGQLFTAAASGDDVTLTYRHQGLRGNELRFQARIMESGTGVTVTPNVSTAFTGGTGSDDIADALEAMEGERFYYIVSALNSEAQLADLAAYVDQQATPERGNRQRFFAGTVGTLNAAISIATGLNNPRGELVWSEESNLPASRLVAHMVGCFAAEQAALGGSSRAINLCHYGDKPSDLWSVQAPFSGKKPTRAQLKAALANGITPVQVLSAGRTRINRSVTTYSLNGVNVDTRVKDSGIILVCDAFADDLLVQVAAQCTGKLLSEDAPKGSSLARDTVSPELIKATVFALIDDYAENGLVRNVQKIKDGVIVALSNTPGRVGIRVGLYPIMIYAQGVMVIDQL